MRKIRITQEQSKEFNRNVKSLLLTHDFAPLPDDYFSKETPVGLLTGSLWSQSGSEIYSVFFRFDDPERAKEKFGCNPFTGKHNFHCSDAQECFGMVEYFLDYLATIPISGEEQSHV
jgi:hypothetical protein